MNISSNNSTISSNNHFVITTVSLNTALNSHSPYSSILESSTRLNENVENSKIGKKRTWERIGDLNDESPHKKYLIFNGNVQAITHSHLNSSPPINKIASEEAEIFQNADKFCELGDFYLESNQADMAMTYYQKAADAKHPRALFHLGQLIYKTDSKKINKALSFLVDSAKLGYKDALKELTSIAAQLEENGKYEKALIFYQAAFDLGSVIAQFWFARMAGKDIIKTDDFQQVIDLYVKVTENQEIELYKNGETCQEIAHFKLGQIYNEGFETPKDKCKALYHFILSSATNYRNSLYFLGSLFSKEAKQLNPTSELAQVFLDTMSTLKLSELSKVESNQLNLFDKLKMLCQQYVICQTKAKKKSLYLELAKTCFIKGVEENNELSIHAVANIYMQENSRHSIQALRKLIEPLISKFHLDVQTCSKSNLLLLGQFFKTDGYGSKKNHKQCIQYFEQAFIRFQDPQAAFELAEIYSYHFLTTVDSLLLRSILMRIRLSRGVARNELNRGEERLSFSFTLPIALKLYKFAADHGHHDAQYIFAQHLLNRSKLLQPDRRIAIYYLTLAANSGHLDAQSKLAEINEES